MFWTPVTPVLHMNTSSNNESIHPLRKQFRINAKSFFLTYPQCPLQKDELKAFLDTKGRVTYTIIGRETHEDGHYHLHALVTYETKLNVKRETFFDFDGYHPNTQAAKNVPALKNYISKEDPAPLIFSTAPEEIDNLYDLARVTPEEEYFEKCRKLKVIHPSYLGSLYVCQSGIPQNTERYICEHDNRGVSDYWDDYIRRAANFAASRGYDFTLGEGTVRCRENNLGTDCVTQTCTIRSPSGYTTRIQKWLPQEHNIRRHVFQPSAKNGSNRTSGSISPSTNSRPLCRCEPSSGYSEDLFVK
jgi:hypothetical protein